jgi:hypothetical protein
MHNSKLLFDMIFKANGVQVGRLQFERVRFLTRGFNSPISFRIIHDTGFFMERFTQTCKRNHCHLSMMKEHRVTGKIHFCTLDLSRPEFELGITESDVRFLPQT